MINQLKLGWAMDKKILYLTNSLLCLVAGIILVKNNHVVSSALAVAFGFMGGAFYAYAKYGLKGDEKPERGESKKIPLA